MRIDLHMHSNCSDGALSPEKLVELCAKQGVGLMSLTDHDTMAGVAAAQEAAKAYGIEVIPGIEISTSWGLKGIHIVGLGLENNDELADFLGNVGARRLDRGREMAQKLEKLGISGALEGALSFADYPESLSRTHFAQWLWKMGYVSDFEEAFRRFLGEGRPCFVATQWPSVSSAVRYIVSHGGVAVLAHPGRYRLGEEWAIDALMDEFVAAGGQAIEVCSGSQSAQANVRFAQAARERHLLASTGSDWHSPLSNRPQPGDQPPLPHDLTPVWTAFGYAKELGD